MKKIDSSMIERIVRLSREYGADCLILFGSYTENPSTARDLDLACDGIHGWQLYEFAGQIENELRIPTDIVPLSPPNEFTRLIENKGKVLYDLRGTA